MNVGFLGHISICQERTVRGTEGGTLTTNCEYGRGWERYKKWWCRGKNWNSCRILVKTTGSEQLVKKGRATIQDYHNQRTITMTLEGLRLDDTDTYWCGIERIGEDLGYKFSVIVDPAPDPTDFPKPVTRPTTASWDSTFPFTLGINSTQPVTLINPDSRALLCNLHFVPFTFVKVPLHRVLLWTVVWLIQSRGDPGGE
ncbi:CMRF35-like molecule 5 [Phoca vitulina]|uniref:CMRF35-like molecule 5 n=1 Tax=Phoca vitulina TaxID=9720 RepID=UPI001396211A|nr:CMRF35-like molecule 5 [Phoca vitulina]